MAAPANFKEVQTEEEFTREVSGAGLIAIDFYAPWCGPCKVIGPVFASLSVEYPDVTFLKVNGDRLKSICAAFEVRGYPTFVFMRSGQVLGRFSGANVVQLKAELAKHSSSSSAAASVASADGHVSLSPQIAMDKVSCLNQDDSSTVANIFKDNSAYLESDCDEQLLIVIPFTCPVKLHSISLRASSTQGPKTVKLFVNEPNVDFSLVEDMDPTQELVFSASQLDGTVVPLKYVCFQKVSSLTIFVEDNQEDEDTTIIERLQLFGQEASGLSMAGFARVAGKAGETESGSGSGGLQVHRDPN